MTVLGRRCLAASILMGALTLSACGTTPDDDAGDQPDSAATAEAPAAEQSADGDTLTMAEVEAHDSADSCWTAIDGTVYDVTAWIDQHPGGASRIEQLCGTDGTAQFQGQHDGQQNPEEQLAEFEIGQLEG